MPYLVAAVVLVGCLCIFDLVLTLGVIRRLRELTALVDRVGAGHGDHGPAPHLDLDGKVKPGERVGDFAAVTTAGGRVARETLTGTTLVGFFSPGCEPCEELKPEFIAYAERHDGPVLAVIAADGEPTADSERDLGAAGDVAVEVSRGPLNTAFGVVGYPSLFLVDGTGMVLAIGGSIRELPRLASA